MNSPRGRNDDWIRRASELKRSMDADQADLDRVLKALAELLAGFPDTEKPLLAFLAPTYVLDEQQRTAALKRVQTEQKRAADEAERIGRFPVR
jgi:ABC-type transporter Mla subunit MlaD